MKLIYMKTGQYITLVFLGILGITLGSAPCNAVSLRDGFPIFSDALNNVDHVSQSAVNFDYDKDGQTEIIMGAFEYIYFIDSQGNTENQYGPIPGSCSAPSIADIDHDGELEIVFGGLIQVGPTDYYPAIYAIRADMNLVPNFPVAIWYTGGVEQPGPHQIVWDATSYPSGVYFARLEVGKKSQNIKMILLK